MNRGVRWFRVAEAHWEEFAFLLAHLRFSYALLLSFKPHLSWNNLLVYSAESMFYKPQVTLKNHVSGLFAGPRA